MKNQPERTAEPHVCPFFENWRRFSHGLLEEEDSLRLATHLDTCDRCLTLVRSFDDESDSAIWMAQVAEADYSQEPEFRKLTQWLTSEHRSELSQWLPSADAAQRHPVDVPADLPNPLDDYRLLERLGRGSMGCVYKAQHVRLMRLFAVKVLAPKYGRAQDLVARFEREMQAIGRLSHPNIVAATDAGEYQGHSFLVMEYVEGLDLQTILRRLGPLSIADACEAMRQACLGLEAAHQQKLVHRDVKPSNLLLSGDGVVKVLDLGLVTPAAAESTGRGRTSPVGTAPYMAPEQWRGDAVDIRVDIYGAGCTLFKLLTGRAPFEQRNSTIAAQRKSHCEQPPPEIVTLLPEVPPALAAVFERALAKRREDRFGSPAELAEALEPFATGADLSQLVPRARAFAMEDTQLGSREKTLVGTLASAALSVRRTRSRRILAWTVTVVAVLAGLAGSAALLPLSTRSRGWVPLDAGDARDYWAVTGFGTEIQPTRVNGEESILVKARELSLVSLGTSNDATYAIRTAFAPERHRPTGLFFGAEKTHDRLFSYAIQVRDLTPDAEKPTYLVALHRHEVRQNPSAPMSMANLMLDSETGDLPAGGATITLEIRLTEDRLRVLVDERPAIDVAWADLKFGRELTQPADFGLITYHGDVVFSRNGFKDL